MLQNNDNRHLSYDYISKRFPGNIKDIWNIKDVVENTANLMKEKEYLIYTPSGQTYTYEESNRIANKIAHSFTSIGLKKGDRLGVYMSNKPEYVFVLFAVAKLGLIQVPINVNFRENEISYMVEKTEIETIISDGNDHFLKTLSNVAKQNSALKQVIVDDDVLPPEENLTYFSLTKLMTNANDQNPNIDIKEDDIFSILFTSGTTGLPKGAITTHKTAILAAKSVASLPVDSKSRNYNCLPLFHTNAQIYSTLGTRCTGATYIMSDRFSPSKFWDEMIKYKATYFNSLGSIMQILDSATENPPNHPAEFVMVGGTPRELWKRFEKKFNVDVYEGFAMTEAPILFHNCHPDKSKRKIGSFGKPVFFDLDRQIKVINEENEEVKVGIGEMLQKGDGFVTQGYWNSPEANEESFSKDGWFKTGDIVEIDENGDFYFVERDKFLIRVGGENVSSFEVEEIINAHPNIAQSAAIPVEDKYKGEEIKVFIKCINESEEIDFKELVQMCVDKLAYFKVPRYYELIDEFPLTPTERIQKSKLKNLESEREDHGWDRDQIIPNWRAKSAT